MRKLDEVVRDLRNYTQAPRKGERGPRHHAGDLYEHSWWAAMSVHRWKRKRHRLTEGVALEEGMLAALLHDVGKAGDCVFDTAQAGKYGPGTTAKAHVVRGGDLLMGRAPYVIECSSGVSVDLVQMVRESHPSLDPRRLAVTSYMHYDFGLLRGQGDHAFEDYVLKFRTTCKDCGLRPSLSLLKLSIAVSCADIAGASGKRLEGPKEKYESFDPWHKYGMNKDAVQMRDQVIKVYQRRRSRT